MSEQTPTVVLVHGAFAESASWNGVIQRLQARGVDAIAAEHHDPVEAAAVWRAAAPEGTVVEETAVAEVADVTAMAGGEEPGS